MTKQEAEILKRIMKERDDDNGGEPLNAVDRGYHLACEHLYEEIDNMITGENNVYIIYNQLLSELQELEDKAKEQNSEYLIPDYVYTAINNVSLKNRKVGVWNYSYKDDTAVCNICNNEHYLGAYRQYATTFCPKCGAFMINKLDK